jgi:hypothetical protein
MRTETIRGSEQLRSDLFALKEIIDGQIGEVDPIEHDGYAGSQVRDLVSVWKSAEGRYGVAVYGTNDWDRGVSCAQIVFDSGLNIEGASTGWSVMERDSTYTRSRDINIPSRPAFVAKILEAVQFELEQD